MPKPPDCPDPRRSCLLDAAPGAKYKVTLSVAYGAALRASEVLPLKVSDIDSARKVLASARQGTQRPPRHTFSHAARNLARVVAYRQTEDLAFSRAEPVNPLTMRQLKRACHAMVQLAGLLLGCSALSSGFGSRLVVLHRLRERTRPSAVTHMLVPGAAA